MPQLPPITKALLIANIGLFLLQWAVGDLSAGVLPSDSVLSWLMLWPLSNGFDAFSPGASFMPWQLLTYAFLHGGFNHLFFSTCWRFSCLVRRWSRPGARSAF